MTKKDGYKHRHEWITVSKLYNADVKICIKCRRGEK